MVLIGLVVVRARGEPVASRLGTSGLVIEMARGTVEFKGRVAIRRRLFVEGTREI